MSVDYHGLRLKVFDFRTDESGVHWLDLGVGYWVNADHVEIVSE